MQTDDLTETSGGAGEGPGAQTSAPDPQRVRARGEVPQADKAADGGAKRDPAWGAWVVIVGIVALVGVFAIAVVKFHTAADVTTAMGAVSGVIAALVGAYFGIRGATLGQAGAQQHPGGPPSKQPPT